jgi:hypothetical protein
MDFAMDYGLNSMQDDDFKIYVYKASAARWQSPACLRRGCPAGAARAIAGA